MRGASNSRKSAGGDDAATVTCRFDSVHNVETIEAFPLRKKELVV